MACDLWHLIAKVFLKYFTHHTEDIDLLFMLLKALCLRFIPDFQVSFSLFLFNIESVYILELSKTLLINFFSFAVPSRFPFEYSCPELHGRLEA